MAIPFDARGEFRGRLFLVNPHLGRRADRALALGERMVRHLAPAVRSVCVLSHLRTRTAADERARVARELHDGIIQGVLGVQVQLHALSVPMAQRSHELAGELNRLGAVLRDETLSLRDLMQRLNAPEVDPDQLIHVIAEAVQRFQRETGIVTRFVTPLDRLDLSARNCCEVLRIVQEALVNVRKHSGARNVAVRLDAADGLCHLTIQDDGHGFPFAGHRAHTELDTRGLGPRVIRERVRLLGGSLSIVSDPGKGALLEISFPTLADAIAG
jgi:two-component system nitrate/nitrite sensor histidine kinase NarX